jgi:hypothetical protein
MRIFALAACAKLARTAVDNMAEALVLFADREGGHISARI